MLAWQGSPSLMSVCLSKDHQLVILSRMLQPWDTVEYLTQWVIHPASLLQPSMSIDFCCFSWLGSLKLVHLFLYQVALLTRVWKGGTESSYSVQEKHEKSRLELSESWLSTMDFCACMCSPQIKAFFVGLPGEQAVLVSSVEWVPLLLTDWIAYNLLEWTLIGLFCLES